MIFKNEVVTLVDLTHKEGVGKQSGKPYSFYTAIFGDDELNRFQANVGREVAFEGVIPEWIFEAAEAKEKVVVTLRVMPKDFDAKIELVKIEPYEK